MKPYTVTYKCALDQGCPPFTLTAWGDNSDEAEDWFWCSCEDEGGDFDWEIVSIKPKKSKVQAPN